MVAKKAPAKKKDFQKEFDKFMEQAKSGFRKFGEELGVLAKKSEKEIVKASKKGKVHLEIMGLNMQKEKLYYDIGKKAAFLNAKKPLGIPELESFWKKLDKIDESAKDKKKELA